MLSQRYIRLQRISIIVINNKHVVGTDDINKENIVPPITKPIASHTYLLTFFWYRTVEKLFFKKFKSKFKVKLTGKIAKKEYKNKLFNDTPTDKSVGETAFMFLTNINANIINIISVINRLMELLKKSLIFLKYWDKKFAVAADNNQCPKTIPITNSLPWNKGTNSLIKKICKNIEMIPYTIKTIYDINRYYHFLFFYKR